MPRTRDPISTILAGTALITLALVLYLLVRQEPHPIVHASAIEAASAPQQRP